MSLHPQHTYLDGLLVLGSLSHDHIDFSLQVDPNLLGTSSIDTTCTIWALETGQAVGRVGPVSGQVKTQLIAHDKEVYDIAFR